MDVGPHTIRKATDVHGLAPNLRDLDEARRTFTWEAARARLDGLPSGGGINIAHEAVDRHAAGERAGHVAIRWLGRDGTTIALTYRDLRERTNRFANVLAALGVEAGDRVFLLSGRVPELYVAALGSLKHRAVVSPLFSAFGPDPIRQRVQLGSGRVLVTTRRLYERKVAGIRDDLPSLEHVLLMDAAILAHLHEESRALPTGALRSRTPAAG